MSLTTQFVEVHVSKAKIARAFRRKLQRRGGQVALRPDDERMSVVQPPQRVAHDIVHLVAGGTVIRSWPCTFP